MVNHLRVRHNGPYLAATGSRAEIQACPGYKQTIERAITDSDCPTASSAFTVRLQDAPSFF